MEVMSSRRIFKKIISNTEIWHGIESNIQFISVNYYKDYTTLRPIQHRLNYGREMDVETTLCS